jgi:DNA-binding CsgD family transcriptional regulator
MPAAKKVVRRRRAVLDRAQLKQREIGIIADLKAGALSYRKIADKWKVSLPTVNAKARKANIHRPRGRRPMGVTVVPVKIGRPAATPKRRGRPPKKAPATLAPVAKAAKVRRRGRKVARRRAAVVSRPKFMDAFRELLLHHYPAIAYVKVHRLEKVLDKELA